MQIALQFRLLKFNWVWATWRNVGSSYAWWFGTLVIWRILPFYELLKLYWKFGIWCGYLTNFAILCMMEYDVIDQEGYPPLVLISDNWTWWRGRMEEFESLDWHFLFSLGAGCEHCGEATNIASCSMPLAHTLEKIDTIGAWRGVHVSRWLLVFTLSFSFCVFSVL